MKCNFCNSNNTYVKKHHHNYEKNNKKIQFISKRRFCSNCHQLVYDSELDNQAGKIALEIMQRSNKL